MAIKSHSVALLVAFGVTTSAYPGMRNGDFTVHLHKRAGTSDAQVNQQLIGDLAHIGDTCLTPVGLDVKDILIRSGNAISNEAYNTPVPSLGSDECTRDKCCVWKHIADDLVLTFHDSKTGQCTNPARSAVRLGFHDAAGWSKSTGELGGADGSLVLNPEEITRSANSGLQEIVRQTKVWFDKYKDYGISMADLIQFNANLATFSCQQGPRIKTFVGRKDSSKAAPDGLLPATTDSSDFLIELFENKTISASGLAALMGAHTASRQRFVDPARAGDAQDTTPGIWDTLYYQQTLRGAPKEVFTFQSDIVLSKDPRSGPAFSAFAESGQNLWNQAYAREYVRLSLLGVYNINTLIDCTKALPTRN
ncbi:peroxidase [Colletotrichum truncatum]|uniref:Peroxidase n=1 Tax=Colletotrichum truncatum TaxID=5467 RepID=A0ACC3YVR5_COLTU|nr:peroxidase [Colletotrichum truncatum]KAF6791228.1 peroxidase [Colletotrichum truncatum]